MRYSDAFKSLHKSAMILYPDHGIHTKYKVVSWYLEQFGQCITRDGIRPIELVSKFKTNKDVILRQIIELTDAEWKMISEYMVDYSSLMSNVAWVKSHIDFVNYLDTVRAFH
jgi:hypothetical protein